MNKDVTKYIKDSPSNLKKLLDELREIVLKASLNIEEEVKWSRPVFSINNKNFAYLKTAKAYVTLGFFEAENIKSHLDLLEGTGKSMRHIKVKALDKNLKDKILTCVRESVKK